jgi:Zn-finger nucleic acid-binding protein
VICPKCQGFLQTVDRHGVHIEQCNGCRGIFLDRGELEQIANAERRHYGSAQTPRYSDSPPPYGAQRGRGEQGYDSRQRAGNYRDSPPPYGHSGHGGHGGHDRRKKSFLEGLFD